MNTIDILIAKIKTMTTPTAILISGLLISFALLISSPSKQKYTYLFDNSKFWVVRGNNSTGYVCIVPIDCSLSKEELHSNGFEVCDFSKGDQTK